MYLTVLEEFMGCILGQQDETGRKEHSIYYMSKKFIDYESQYSMLEKTCCALAWVAKRLCQNMINHTTWLISKMDRIKYNFEKPALNGRIAHWQMLLSEYDIEYHTRKAVKGSVLVDHLAHQPINDYQSTRNGIGEIIINPKGSHIPSTTILIFDCTNNMAEYEACIMGLEATIDLRIKILDVYGDSALVVNHIKGEWETRRLNLIPYKDYARRVFTFFNKIEFHHIPREGNHMENALATLSSMYKVNFWNDALNITIIRLDRPTHVFVVEEVTDDKP
ncbi:uncharacterized protein LOC127079534 [Lathyrus oleraceus]|uniref:uncharacterized protein LOC127079534 n=1 Tax=Pisum sativum TaxID=3888 RepID=UPI0021D13E2E|nr:uncharacterized protein LOC127079534 [Pisum sativum]